MTATFEIGSIVKSYIPFSSHDDGKDRPCVVLDYYKGIYFLAIITGSNEVNKLKHTNVRVTPDKLNKLRKISVVTCEVVFMKQEQAVFIWKDDAILTKIYMNKISTLTESEIKRKKNSLKKSL